MGKKNTGTPIIHRFAVGYIRVSTTDQANEGVSLEAQEAKIEAWCRSNDFTLNPDNIYRDAGISGKRADNRPALQHALDRVCETGGALIVYSLSRLARSVRDTLAIAERLDKAGADLVSLSERIDTTSASGKMMFRLLSVLAEFERDLISERTTSALNHKRGKGERIGKIPWGSTLGPDGKTLEINPAEMDALRMIRAYADRGMSLRRIAAQLDEDGVPSRSGKSWTHSVVAYLLRREPDQLAG